MGSSALSPEPGIKVVAEPPIRAEVRRSEFRSVDVTWVSTLATTGRFPGLRSRPTTARSAARAELTNWRILCKIHYRPGPGL